MLKNSGAIMISPVVCTRLLIPLLVPVLTASQQREAMMAEKGQVLYENSLSDESLVSDWIMEGPGKVVCRAGWMEMFSPDEKWHHVFWCKREFPSRFIAEWEVQNLHPAAGLLIVFFAARGAKGEDIFDCSLPLRDGTFSFYTKGRMNSYHISYYANNPKNRERELAHLRKNPWPAFVEVGSEGIPRNSVAVHRARLIKNDNSIAFFIDNRKVIDWKDDGVALGAVYGSGKIGFRQMQWSHFRYRNFKVWSIK
jgi:hypothetical protein